MVDVKVTDQVKLMIESLKMFYGKSFIDLIQIFVGRKYEIRLAGETARDLLMKKISKKIELVSSASIYQMRRLFKRNNLPITVDSNDATITLNYGGLHHIYKIATICPANVSSQPECAGTRKAYWMINAYNRTFTIDSIFIDFNGRIYDYFNGYDDVINRRIRMNIDPDTLIKNDYLRIFKYCKLFGSVANAECGHNRKTLRAIMDNIGGLASVKGELIWNEMKTILMHPKRYECIEAFFECGGAVHLGLPENLNLTKFRQIATQSNFSKHPLLGISYLCTFLETQNDVMKLHQRLRLSAYERDLAIFIVKYKTQTHSIDDLAYYIKMCLLPSGVNKQISREYVLELLKYHDKKSLFENLLLMQSPPYHPIDPIMLQWKKRQLRKISDEVNTLNDNEMDSMNERHFSLKRIRME